MIFYGGFLKLKEALRRLGEKGSKAAARDIAQELELEWEDGLCYVFASIIADPERIPGNVGGKADDERTTLRKWLLRYKRGQEGCASRRESNTPGTVADPVIEEIIKARLSALNSEDLERIQYAHRLAMSAENILGLILEEYLAVNLRKFGWYCAWGETVRSVDFVHKTGKLLQIKNRSNSENSSSSAIRTGTNIEKWYRIKADRLEYLWDSLNKICGTTHLSEESFVRFAQKTILENPNCLAVEDENPWGKSAKE